MSIEYIADPGTNYLGDMELLKKMAYECKNAGVTWFKPQVFDASLLYKPENNPYLDLQKECTMTIEQVQEIYDFCASIDLQCMFSVFDVGRLRWLEDIGCEYVKVASSMAANDEFLKEIADHGFKVIISISPDARHHSIWHYKDMFKDVRFMHCRMKYPSEIKDYSLESIRVFGGVSDHTSNIYLAIASAAVSATLIEKHVYESPSLAVSYLIQLTNTPDFGSSISIDMLGNLVMVCNQINDGMKITSEERA